MKNCHCLFRIVIPLFCLMLIAGGCAPKSNGNAADTDIELTQKHNYAEPPYVDYSLTDVPEFAEDISQCTDTEKQYVLPDGLIYEYQKVMGYSAKNQLTASVDEDGSIFNGCGYQNNTRIRSILVLGDYDNAFVTGFMPVTCGDIIYFSGNCFDPGSEDAHVLNTVFYDSDKRVVSAVSMKESTGKAFEVIETNSEGYISAMKLKDIADTEGVSFVRFSLLGSGSGQTVSINEPLVLSNECYGWAPSEEYISEDWYEEIDTAVNKINGIKLTNEANTVKFIFASDMHVDPEPTDDTYTQDMGKVCAAVMQGADIPFFVTGGDNSTQSSGFMPDVFEKNMETVLEYLSPIPRRNILLSVGNHDGETGMCEYEGETVYYRYQLNNEERSSVFFDWQRESNEYKHFDSDGTYYYIDDSSTKTRYILLNSFWSDWEGNEDGFVPNIQHSFGHTPIFGPQQLKWFAEEALDMPPEYGAVIVTHFAPDANDFYVFQGIVDAFSNQTVYEGEYIGVEDWQSTKISVNYKDAYGEIIAVFQGHRHTDAVFDYFEKVPCINITTAGAWWAIKDEDPENRVKGTASEFAVDAVVIDRESRTIYCTRVGAGEDRTIKY